MQTLSENCFVRVSLQIQRHFKIQSTVVIYLPSNRTESIFYTNIPCLPMYHANYYRTNLRLFKCTLKQKFPKIMRYSKNSKRIKRKKKKKFSATFSPALYINEYIIYTPNNFSVVWKLIYERSQIK